VTPGTAVNELTTVRLASSRSSLRRTGRWAAMTRRAGSPT